MARIRPEDESATRPAVVKKAAKKRPARKKAAKKSTARKRVQPVVKVTKNEAHSPDHQTGQDQPSMMPATGSVSREDLETSIETVYGPGFKEKADYEAFMHEEVDVEVHETTDENADPLPCVWVNGRPQRFHRGHTQTVKRKYVEGLARAKQTAISTREVMQDGERAIRIDRHTGLRYPFSVVSDPNPLGRPWLKKILAEA